MIPLREVSIGQKSALISLECRRPPVTLALIALLAFPVSSLGDDSLEAAVFTAKEIEVAERLRETALESNLAYTLLESLTVEVGPRLAGSENDKRAVNWAVENFGRLGFDRVWTEEFPFQIWQRGEASASIESPFKQRLVVTALGNSPPTPPEGIEAEIVEFESFEALRGAEESDIGGKIVFINEEVPRSEDGSGYGKAVFSRMFGAIESSKKGALGIVIRSVGTSNARLPHTGLMQSIDSVASIPALALSAPDADLLHRMNSRGEPVFVHIQSTSKLMDEMGSSTNVMAEIDGSEVQEEFVLLGAHLDSWDLGTGAVDDGVGVVVAMAASRLIAQLEDRPSRTIRVVLFGAEEFGLVGAQAYAKRHEGEIDNHIIATELDFGAARTWRMSSHVDEAALPAIRAVNNSV